MKLYEMRTYDIRVGKMAEVQSLYLEQGYPILETEGYSENLVGYFISDTGRLHQLIHIWRFDGDQGRRAFWDRLATCQQFMDMVAKLRPLVICQEIQLLRNAPWGHKP
tara:strand:+ start:32561 stop:32884 length:324 start_codon:yes stop_codon:yes gene_type:complete